MDVQVQAGRKTLKQIKNKKTHKNKMFREKRHIKTTKMKKKNIIKIKTDFLFHSKFFFYIFLALNHSPRSVFCSIHLAHDVGCL